MTRLLHSCISSRCMEDSTMDDLNRAWAEEALSLYENGYEAVRPFLKKHLNIYIYIHYQ